MNTLKTTLTILFTLAVAPAVMAQVKIGFVDSYRAVISTDEGKAENQKIEDWLKKQDDQIKDLQKQLNDKQAQYQNQQNLLADEKKEELLKEIDGIDTSIKRKTEDTKKEYARRLDEFGKLMEKKITPLFNEFAKDNGYTAIFYLNPQVLAYCNPDSDITAAIIKLYNQKFPFTIKPPAPPAKSSEK